MATFPMIEMRIIQRAEAEKIIPSTKPAKQVIEILSAVCDLAKAKEKNEIIDAVGQIMTSLTIYCILADVNLVGSMEVAYRKKKHEDL